MNLIERERRQEGKTTIERDDEEVVRQGDRHMCDFNNMTCIEWSMPNVHTAIVVDCIDIVSILVDLPALSGMWRKGRDDIDKQ